MQNCEKKCDQYASEWLNGEDVLSLENCIRLAWDCADFCSLAAILLDRNSKRKYEAVEMCIKTGLDCAAECEKFDHPHCKSCALACRRCVENCRKYLKNNQLSPGLV